MGGHISLWERQRTNKSLGPCLSRDEVDRSSETIGTPGGEVIGVRSTYVRVNKYNLCYLCLIDLADKETAGGPTGFPTDVPPSLPLSGSRTSLESVHRCDDVAVVPEPVKLATVRSGPYRKLG